MKIFVTILLALFLSGCTGMLLGGNVQPAEESQEDDESDKKG